MPQGAAELGLPRARACFGVAPSPCKGGGRPWLPRQMWAPGERKKKKENKKPKQRGGVMGTKGAESLLAKIYQVGKNAKEFHTVKKQLRPERERERERGAKASNSEKERGRKRWRERKRQKKSA